MSQLPFYEKQQELNKILIENERPKKLFSRQMRAYLVKDEPTFERLALQKYQEDENEAN